MVSGWICGIKRHFLMSLYIGQTFLYDKGGRKMGIFAIDGKLAVFLNTLGNLMVLNLLTLLCSLPVFTAGAAMTALYTSTQRMARKEDGGLIAGYFKAFRDNFRQATVLWLIGGGIILFMLFDIRLLQSVTGTFGLVYRCLLLVLVLLFVLELIYSFAVLARFENTLKNTAKNALLFCAGKIGPALLMLAITALPVILFTISYRFLPVLVLLGISGPAYLASIYFVSLFQSYEK